MIKDKIKFFSCLDSTNLYARQNFNNLENNDIILAEKQTAGRGRFGRAWHSPPVGNLYFSIVLKNSVSPKNAGNLGQVASVAVSETLETIGLDVEIKWPNDILVSSKKICGILCESVESSEQGRGGYIVGIGLNVNMSVEELANIPNPATSIFAETGKISDCLLILEKIIEKFFPLLERLEKFGFSSILGSYQKHCRFIGKKITISFSSGDRKKVSALSINPNGTLHVLTEEGEFLDLHSAEIT